MSELFTSLHRDCARFDLLQLEKQPTSYVSVAINHRITEDSERPSALM